MRFNRCRLYGMICEINISKDVGFGVMRLAVMRPDRVVEDGRNKNQCDTVKIMTQNPVMIEKMETMSRMDMVDVVGVVTTGNLVKRSYCPECGAENSKDGVIMYVLPTAMKQGPHMASKDEAFNELLRNREFSNSVEILAEICVKPKSSKTTAGKITAKYTLASNKLYRERQDPPENRTNYPVVVTYGQDALDTVKHLHVGSGVHIDGCLQARRVKQHTVCEKCGAEYDWLDETGEIVPLHTSYVRNYLTDEDIEDLQKQFEDEMQSSIFGA